MNTRAVTEQDFRMPEFRDQNPNDYEFREDGKIVRKDRWKRAVQSLVGIVGMNVRNYDIAEVLATTTMMEAASRNLIEAVADEIWDSLQDGSLYQSKPDDDQESVGSNTQVK